jgi:hypothetical protein
MFEKGRPSSVPTAANTLWLESMAVSQTAVVDLNSYRGPSGHWVELCVPQHVSKERGISLLLVDRARKWSRSIYVRSLSEKSFG